MYLRLQTRHIEFALVSQQKIISNFSKRIFISNFMLGLRKATAVGVENRVLGRS